MEKHATPVECVANLNLIGEPAVVKHISRCWASLFTERAVAYRLQQGFDHREVRMAVVVQVGDRGNHAYISVGHGQMMTDPMKPLGLSLFQLTAGRPMYAAGGRLYGDVTKELASPAGRNVLLNVAGGSDPLIKDALTTLIERGDFIEPSPTEPEASGPGPGKPGMPLAGFQAQIDDDPASVAELIARSQASIEALKRDIQTKSGTELLDFILEDIQLLKRSLTEPRSFGALMAGMNAATWINENMMTCAAA